jgi:formate/nitrite transporter FocA (FNT family)
MYSTIALLHRRISIFDYFKTLFLSFFANLAGALVFTIVLIGYGGTFETEVYKDEALAYAKTKAVTPEWHQIFLRGIICTIFLLVLVY